MAGVPQPVLTYERATYVADQPLLPWVLRAAWVGAIVALGLLATALVNIDHDEWSPHMVALTLVAIVIAAFVPARCRVRVAAGTIEVVRSIAGVRVGRRRIHIADVAECAFMFSRPVNGVTLFLNDGDHLVIAADDPRPLAAAINAARAAA